MIIFTTLGIFTAIFFLVVIFMSIIESRIKNRTKAKLLWNMDRMESRDKVVTRTGGLARDRIYEVENEDVIMDKMEENER